MAEWRKVVDDARRFGFVLSLLGGVATAVWAGTSWFWWSAMGDLEPPLRVLGGVAMGASVFVAWYGLLFTGYYYFRTPARNPLFPYQGDLGAPEPLQVSLWGDMDGDVYYIDIRNNGPTDTFTSYFQIAGGIRANPTGGPHGTFRWAGSHEEKREIVTGATARLELIRIVSARDTTKPPAEQRSISSIALLTPSGERDLPISWYDDRTVINTLQIDFTLTGMAVNTKGHFELRLEAACSVLGVRIVPTLTRRSYDVHSM